VTDDSAFKKQVRTRMAETGENYTTARRMVIAGRNPGQQPAALRVYLNPHVDLELTDETARAFAAADEQGQRDLASRLLAAWTTSGLISALPGPAWCSAMAARRPTGSVPTWRN
jgi:hypothetical protein